MIRFGSAAFAMSMIVAASGEALAQLPKIVINEIVDDIRTAGSGNATDDREFIELYNADNVPVNIGDWTLNYWVLGSMAGGGAYTPVNDTIPAGTILQPGDYYVVGNSSVPNVDLPIDGPELFPDANTVYELRNGAQGVGVIVDAVGVETYLGQELGNANPDTLPQLGRGWWGQMISTNSSAPNSRMALARYRNGRDSNNNGLDFGVLPLTPGTSNELPLVDSYAIPDAAPLAVGAEITANHYTSFVFPHVIDPMVQDEWNPKSIGYSPQGGKAIIAYDNTTGGNAVYSKQRVNAFSLAAYIETGALGVADGTTNNVTASEASIYGIGTTDPFFGSPDSTGLLGFGSSANGSTGLGWLIQRAETFDVGTATLGPTETVVQLVNMKGGGESVQDIATTDWEVITTITLTGQLSNWHNLSIDYDPVTGDVVAKFDDQTFNFDSETDMTGTFYVGYREDVLGNFTNARPPTYDIALAPTENADFNDDDIVDGADFLLWQRNFGGDGGLPQGDADGNGQINAADLTIWKSQFGTSPAVAAVAAVPEPACCLLLGTAVIGMPFLRRKSSTHAL
jgi:hypothetical protein